MATCTIRNGLTARQRPLCAPTSDLASGVDKFAANTPDLEWLGALAAEGGWIVVSIDRFKKSTAEREMLRRQGLTVFVLDPQWSKPYWGQAAQLVLWWPKIVDVAKLTSKTALTSTRRPASRTSTAAPGAASSGLR